jgi:hypothetical protein
LGPCGEFDLSVFCCCGYWLLSWESEIRMICPHCFVSSYIHFVLSVLWWCKCTDFNSYRRPCRHSWCAK